MAEQSLSQDAWARFPERSEEQPGGFRGFDFASERSMLHAHNLRAAQHAEAGTPPIGVYPPSEMRRTQLLKSFSSVYGHAMIPKHASGHSGSACSAVRWPKDGHMI